MDKGKGKVSLHPEFKQAVKDILDTFTYGDTISKDWVKEHLDIVFPRVGTPEEINKIQVKYMARVEAMRNELLVEHRMYLVTKPGKGFLICKPENQTAAALERYTSKFAKETQKAKKTLTNLNTTRLTQEDIQKRDDALNSVAAVSAFSGKRLTDV